MKVEELKEKARRHEMREEWQQAFDLYTSALQIRDEDEPPDITLYNRVGDIQTRLGQINGAVEQYERAIQLYLEAELPNNAIAICKKVLRNLPERNVFFLRMGQIRAGQGFLTDARQNFLTYAERQTNLGDIESALNALVEFVEISPEDLEIRQSLASQLEAHERTDEAVVQYTEVHRQLVLSGEEEQANEIEAKLGELAPDLMLPDAETILSELTESEPEEMVLESTSLSGMELPAWGDDTERAEAGEGDLGEAVEVEESDEADVAAEYGSVELDEDLTFVDPGLPDDGGESMKPEAGSESETEDHLASFELGADEEAEDEEDLPDSELGAEDDSLPLIGFDDDDEAEVEVEGKLDEEALSVLGFQVEDEDDSAFEEEEDDLPLLGFDDESDDEDEGVSAEAEDALEAAVEDATFEDELEEPEAVETAEAEEALEPDEEAEPVEALEAAEEEDLPALPGSHEEAAAEGDMDLAIERVRALIGVDLDSVQLHQRLVEYAFRKNDQDELISAYLELAGCLARTDAPVKAKAVFQQVLTLSPDHEGAIAGIDGLEGGTDAGSPAQVASSEEYVDLGSMILGDEVEATTRWTVAADAPSGDEEADFAKMLNQFKDKVSEHVAADDVSAHYDLGTAYMEMGLFDEAIAEFQMALRASPNHLPTHEVMGRCWMEMGKPDMAVRALNRALDVAFEVEDELIGIYYLMGRAQEDQGNREEALDFYEKVFFLDINFEDVTERLRALR